MNSLEKVGNKNSNSIVLKSMLDDYTKQAIDRLEKIVFEICGIKKETSNNKSRRWYINFNSIILIIDY